MENQEQNRSVNIYAEVSNAMEQVMNLKRIIEEVVVENMQLRKYIQDMKEAAKKVDEPDQTETVKAPIKKGK